MNRNQKGFTYIALLAAIVIIGITLSSAGKYWQNISVREKEQELLFRGDQYRVALERYASLPGRPGQLPESIDDLLKDNRTVEGKRYLRQKFKDPITGEDFAELRDPLSRRIVGVHSTSDREPMQQSNFPLEYAEFEGKKKYSEWIFQFKPAQANPLVPLQPGQTNPLFPLQPGQINTPVPSQIRSGN